MFVDRAGNRHEVHAGGKLSLRADGRTFHGRTPIVGESWAWVQHAAPPLDIEGASLETFLHWVSRETGRSWRFAEPDLQPAASEVILHGSLEGLTAEESLLIVLPGCGFRHRLVEDELWIDRIVRLADPPE